MRALALAALILLGCQSVRTFAQSFPNDGAAPQVGERTELSLPKSSYKPQLSLQDALKIAERYVNEKLLLSRSPPEVTDQKLTSYALY